MLYWSFWLMLDVNESVWIGWMKVLVDDEVVFAVMLIIDNILNIVIQMVVAMIIAEVVESEYMTELDVQVKTE